MSLLVLLCYAVIAIDRVFRYGIIIRKSLTLIGLTNSHQPSLLSFSV